MFKSNTKAFFDQYEDKVHYGLDAIGRMLKDEIKVATPVRTGELRDSNDFKVEDKALYMYNTAKHAPFVELGTIFQVSQPFMRATIWANVSKIKEIMLNNLKV